MKRAFHDFLTICSSDLSDRQKEKESIHDIRGYVEKRSRFLDALPLPFLPLVRAALLASNLNGPGFAFTKKKNVYRIRHDVRVQL